jgi:hypothetical protein
VNTPARFFHNILLVCKVFVSVGFGNISTGLGGAVRMCRHSPAFGACLGGVAMCQAPEPGPTRGDRGELSGLSVRPFAALSQGGGARCLRLPSCGSRIVDPLLSC